MKKQVLMTERKRKKIRSALKNREDVLRAQIRSVVQGYTTSMFVFGPGGLGKSHILQDELDSLCGKGWQHHTAYTTPKALMLSLHESPDSVHVFEDSEKLYKTDVGSSILRSACGSPKEKERWVTYETANETMRVNFRGGIIIASNENIGKSQGPLAAVASRFRPILWDLTVDERICRILDIAEDGWRRGMYVLTAKECRECATFLVQEMLRGDIHTPVDLRTYTEHALPAYAQFRGKQGGVGWQDVIRSKLQGMVGKIERRDERNNRLEKIAVDLDNNAMLTGAKRLAEWTAKTKLGKSQYYIHLRLARSAVANQVG